MSYNPHWNEILRPPGLWAFTYYDTHTVPSTFIREAGIRKGNNLLSLDMSFQIMTDMRKALGVRAWAV